MDFYDPDTTPKYHQLYHVFWSLDDKLNVLKSIFTASNSVCSSFVLKPKAAVDRGKITRYKQIISLLSIVFWIYNPYFRNFPNIPLVMKCIIPHQFAIVSQAK